MHSSRQVLTMLKDEGIDIHRETLARVSDQLELPTRPAGARGVPRNWSPEHVVRLITHFQANGWKSTVPVRRHSVTESDGPFSTRDVLSFLASNGFSMHRETLARISDDLQLHTREVESPTVQRRWTRQQVKELLEFLHARPLANLTTQGLRALLKANPSLADRLRSVLLAQTETSPTSAPGHPGPAPADEEAA